MNNRLLYAIIISAALHFSFFVIRANTQDLSPVKANVVKGAGTLEVSLVRNVPGLKVMGTSAAAKEPAEFQSALKKAPKIPFDNRSPVSKIKEDFITEIKKQDTPKSPEADDSEANAYSSTAQQNENEKSISKISVPKINAGAITREITSLLMNQPPVYPQIARIKGWAGEVLILAKVDFKGNVTSADIIQSSGYNVLDASAREAVLDWKFKNVSSNIEVKIPIRFVLTDR